ncbi:MAG TPA: hypothetical protein VMK30_01120 [Pleomorphomonadaceae bacterium]|nr:hypothetical protein [Pleomorphomonadaceae bacterium]
MAGLLWLAIGAGLGVLSWLLPELTIVVPLIVTALTLVGILLPRDLTSAGAKLGIGFGAVYLVAATPTVIRDPLAATGAAYLVFGAGLVILILGLAGVWRNRRRRARDQARAAESEANPA